MATRWAKRQVEMDSCTSSDTQRFTLLEKNSSHKNKKYIIFKVQNGEKQGNGDSWGGGGGGRGVFVCVCVCMHVCVCV